MNSDVWRNVELPKKCVDYFSPYIQRKIRKS